MWALQSAVNLTTNLLDIPFSVDAEIIGMAEGQLVLDSTGVLCVGTIVSRCYNVNCIAI